MADLTVKQKQIFDNYKKTHPQMSSEEILSALVNLGKIELSEEQKLTLFNNYTNNNYDMGLKLEHSANSTKQQETVFLQSGRKIVITKLQDGKELYKYYAADGTQLKPEYFKQQEGIVKVSADRKTYTVTKSGKTVNKQVKDPITAKYEQEKLSQALKEQESAVIKMLEKKLKDVEESTQLAEENNGLIGKTWSWMKNTIGFGDSSNKVKEQRTNELKILEDAKNGKISAKQAFEEITGAKFNKENIDNFLDEYNIKNDRIKTKSEKALDNYKEGQEMAVDITTDIATGLVAAVCVAGAPMTLTTFALAGGVGMITKTILKGTEGATGGRSFMDSCIDPKAFGGGLVTGLLTPLTFGMGGAITNTASKLIGKSVAARAATFVARESSIGAVWGGSAEGFNEFQEEITNSESSLSLNKIATKAFEGALGGAAMGVLMSGGIKGLGKITNKIKNRNLDEFGNKIEQPQKPAKPRKSQTLEGGIKDTELDEVAPFAKRLEETAQLKIARENYEKLETSVMSKVKDKANSEELELAQNILNRITPENEHIVKIMLEDETISNELIFKMLDSFTVEGIQNPVLAMFAMQHMLGPVAQFKNNSFKIQNAEKLLSDILSKKSNIPKEQLPDIIRNTTKKNQELYSIADGIEGFDYNYLPAILRSTLSTDTTNTIVTSAKKVKLAKYLMSKKDFPVDCIADIVKAEHLEPKLTKYLCDIADFPKSEIADILRSTQMVHNEWTGLFGDKLGYKVPMVYRLVKDAACPKEVISDIVSTIDSKQIKLFEKLYSDNSIAKGEISGILQLEYALRKGSKLDFKGKVSTLIASAKIKPETLDNLDKYGLNKNKILKLIDDINMEMGGAKNYHIITDMTKQKTFLSKFLANNNLKTEAMLKDLDLAQFKGGLPLKYSRNEFISDVKKLINKLDKAEQERVLEHFNLKFVGNDFESIPHVKPNSMTQFDKETSKIVQLIQEKLDDFAIKNTVMIEDKELKSLFDGLVQGLPEFTSIIGKVQHGTHAYTVDIHTLKVLQNAIKNPDYAHLTDKDKTILKLSILLHDLGKQAAVVDEGHYEISAKYAIGILEKFNLSDNVKNRIIELVNNHHWFEAYNKGKASPEFVASLFRTENDLNIAKIMAKADLEGVNPNFHYTKTGTHTQKAFDDFMQSKFWAIDAAHQRVQTTASIVMNSKFRQTATRHFPIQKVLIKGKEYNIPVLNLMDDNVSYNLEQYGFAPGVTKDSARFIVHMQNHIPNLKVFMSLSQSPTTNSVQSMSVISKNNNRTFQNYIYGVIGEVDSQNISQAYYSNISSGYKKSMKSFSQGLFTSWEYRTYLRNEMVKELKKHQININADEYAKLSEYLQTLQYSSQITKDFRIGNKIIPASTLKEVVEKTTDALFEGRNIHSELVVLNPKVKALVARVSSIEECSPEFLELAQQNNLPIILTGFKNGM